MSIIKAIKQSFIDKERKGFEKLFYFVDLHSTCIKPNYSAKSIPTEFYPMAKEALQLLSNSDEICLIMYTCSQPDEVAQYVEFFKENGIVFEYVNENPEVTTEKGGYGNYDTKPYINVLMDDKAGFDGEEDWLKIFVYFSQRYDLTESLKTFSEADIEQLYGEIENEGLGYWITHYSYDWHGKDDIFDTLLSDNNINEIEKYFEIIGVIQ